DPACGSGAWLTPSLSDSASGCDLNPNMVAWTRAKIGGDIRCGDMCDLPFDSDTFDVAINPDATISHLHSYEMIGRHLSEVERVLSPGGVYLLGIPLRNEVFPRRDGDLAYDSGI